MEENESGVIALDGALDLAAAPALAQRLLARVGFDLSLDASSASHLGAPCAQVLLAARQTWRCDGKTLRFLNPSAQFGESVRLLGLETQLLGDI